MPPEWPKSSLEDVFDLQDQITAKVVATIEPTLRMAEVERSKRKRPEELGAYDLYLQALPLTYSTGREQIAHALDLLEQSISIDPNYAYSHALIAWCYTWRRSNALARDETQDVRALEHANRALALDPDDPEVLCSAALAYSYVARDPDRGLDLVNRSLALNPNSIRALWCHGHTSIWLGQHAQGLEDFRRAKRLSPVDPMTWFFDAGAGSALTGLERYDEALACLKQALRANPEATSLYRGIVICAAYLGLSDEAHHAVERIIENDPTMSVSKWRRISPQRGPTLERVLHGLRLAGLPE